MTYDAVNADTALPSGDSSGDDIILYIEEDDKPGLTYGDTRLKIGDRVHVGVVVVVGECRVW